MNADMPAPLVPAEVDIRGFSGFMLDVDRLLASELVALGTPEECWAALLLWCRAWKQSPPASLPDDDRVLAAFSGAGRRWAKVKVVALRGFVKCADGRLYHPVLAEEALRGWKKRQQYGADQERLRKWREGKKDGHRNAERNDRETDVETHFNGVAETPSETVREPERQGQYSTDSSLRSESDRAAHRKSDIVKPTAHGKGSRIPPEWRPDEAMRQFAADEGLSQDRIDRIAAGFLDFWRGKAGKDACKTDWDATWRNWVRREVERLGRPPPNGRATTGVQSALAGVDAWFNHERDR